MPRGRAAASTRIVRLHLVARLRSALDWLQSHRWALVTLQLLALTLVLGFFFLAFRGAWQDAKPLLRAAGIQTVPGTYFARIDAISAWSATRYGISSPHAASIRCQPRVKRR